MAGPTFDNAQLNLQGVTSITVSDIVADPDSGGYVRQIQFYTDPTTATNRRPVLIVMAYGDQSALEILTPNLQF